MFVDAMYFILRYTPWWSVPMLAISAYFFYVYRLKDIHRVGYVFAFLAFVSLFFLSYYIYMGGPDGAALYFSKLIRSF